MCIRFCIKCGRFYNRRAEFFYSIDMQRMYQLVFKTMNLLHGSYIFFLGTTILFSCNNLQATWMDRGEGLDNELIRAVSVGNVDTVENCLDQGAAINQEDGNGSTALHLASIRGHEAVVNILLGRGVAVDQENLIGYTALNAATCTGQEAVVSTLLNHGAAINQSEHDGWTSLHWAARWGQGEIVNILLNWGSAINQAENNGYTALHIAAQEGHELVVSTLLNHGAAMDQENSDGATAMQLAVREGHASVVCTLLRRGADVVTVRNHDVRHLLEIIARNGQSDAIAEALIALSHV